MGASRTTPDKQSSLAMSAAAGAGGMSRGPRAGMTHMGPSGGTPSSNGPKSGKGAMSGAGMSGSGAGGTTGGGGMGGDGGGAPTRRSCGAMEVHRRLLNENPQYAAARSLIEDLTAGFAPEARVARHTGVVTIPVVVHVVWNTADQNVSDAQIQSQIDVLNRDFRAQNTDVGQTPAAFAGLVADAQVEFALATTDPVGNPHSGIERAQTSTASFGTDDAVKFVSGATAWPSDRYLNLWVCQLGGGLLGYAQFPGGPPETDGVVITHTGFGTTGTASPPFHLGRTATHEIGHWLNLYHIWGDDGFGCSGSDEVADTPNQAGANVGCPTFPHVTCNNGPNGDLFVNYMDYVDDPCMVMFSLGQVGRMDACLEGPRASFLDVTPVGAPRAVGPVVSWGLDRLDVFVLGSDSAQYHKWWDGSNWGPSVADWEYQGGVCLSVPEVVSWGVNRLDSFVLGTDHGIWHKAWDGAQWHPAVDGWESLGGVCTSPPRVVSWGPGRLDVFVRGTDHAMWHKWWDGSAWGPSVADWEYQGGICQSRPEVVSWAADRLDAFVLGTDYALWHKWWDGSAWSDWESLGGVCASAPEAVAWGPNRIDVFVLGTDQAIWHRWWDGNAWGGWESLGGTCMSPPQVVAWAPGRLDLFVTGTDSATYHKAWDGTQWTPSISDWEWLGGICTSPPRVTAWGPSRLDVFVTGTDSALWHKAWTGSAWHPSPSDWESLSGIITDF